VFLSNELFSNLQNFFAIRGFQKTER